MYSDRVACCPLVSRVEYAPTEQTGRRTDGRQTVALRSPLDVASIINDSVLYVLPVARRIVVCALSAGDNQMTSCRLVYQ